jgi:hypothetical protein
MEIKYKGRTYRIYFDSSEPYPSGGKWTAQWKGYSADSAISKEMAIESCHEMIEEDMIGDDLID